MKTIILCLDGTWNEPDKGKTNVQRLYELTKSTETQVAFYQKGVGTDWWNRLTGGVFGIGLFDQIKSAYLDLVNNYQPGDRVITVGFSRGAYAARSLAGFISRCGVLKERILDIFDIRDKNAIDDLWQLYKQDSTEKLDRMIAKECHLPHDGLVEAVAVFDTVGALGIPREIMPESFVGKLSAFEKRHFDFKDTQLNPKISRGYHAVALDETRKPFTPTLWNDSERIEEVWFAGVHTDIGGGFETHGLSDLTLTWMLNKLKKNHTIEFEVYAIEENGRWDAIGTTRMEKKLGLIDNPLLDTIESRIVPDGAKIHESAMTRIAGEGDFPSIKSLATFGKNLVTVKD